MMQKLLAAAEHERHIALIPSAIANLTTSPRTIQGLNN